MSKRTRGKKRTAFRDRSRRRKPGDLHTILSFCESNAISESLYYSLKRQGRGPREIKLGNRTLITPEAERDWRLAREAETAVSAEGRRRQSSKRSEP